MSKLNQIQNKLLELSGGAFQKLADSYLHRKGYERLNPIGSVIGADKVRKGTPDALVTLPNGKSVFAEYTTQQENLYGKLSRDLAKCFNEAKTGVPVEKIEEVVFCHTSILSAGEEKELAELCQKHGVNLNIFGIGPISQDLYQKYPGLARDFLGVQVDTGQILSPDEFVAVYGRNKLATPLDTAFHFREQELKQVLQSLEMSDLAIVSGRPGVGKSRFGLECCERFRQIHPEYQVQCLFDKGVDLFEDLRVYFSEPGFFLILVDDANRVSQFEYITQLLLDQREDQQIKAIATVRDYALDVVSEAARTCGITQPTELKPFEEKELKQLVETEFGVRNPLYLDRIADVAKGSPRLAAMAAQVARRENTLQSINDVSSLYDEYFASIRKDLQELEDSALLKVAGIVAFFRVVDRSNTEMMNAIEAAFGISSNGFWDAVHQLHRMEVIDIYEDEVVRTSDQVLATYLFYLACFKQGALDFASLLAHFFPRFQEQFVECIYPAVNAFDSEHIIRSMQPPIERVWKTTEASSDEQGLLYLMSTFWFVRRTETLLYIQRQIQQMQQVSVELLDLEFKASSPSSSPSLLSILSGFRHDLPNFHLALELVLDYVTKQPSAVPEVLYLLTDSFGFRHDSWTQGFAIQRTVLDMLWDRTGGGQEVLFCRLFIAVAKPFVHINFSVDEASRRGITMRQFSLPPTLELLELRQAIWNHVFQLERESAMHPFVFDLLQSYVTLGFPGPVGTAESKKGILADDAKILLPFIGSRLEPENYQHCVFVHDYLDLLEQHNVPFEPELRDRFTSDIYHVSVLLRLEWVDRSSQRLGYEEARQLKRKRINEHFAGSGLSDYIRFFGQCMEIRMELAQEHEKAQLRDGAGEVLLSLAESDPNLYVDVLEYYLTIDDILRLNYIPLVDGLVGICGPDRAYEILSQPDYPTKRGWLFSFHRPIPDDAVTVGRLEELYTLYHSADRHELPGSFDYLLKYRSLDGAVVARVTEILLARAEADPNFYHSFSLLFNHLTEANKSIIDLFADHLDVLKQLYLAVAVPSQLEDYDGRMLTRILDLDPEFMLECVDWMYARFDRPSHHDDHRDYTFLWQRNDSEALMGRVASRIYEHEREKKMWIPVTYLETFFRLKENRVENQEIIAKQDQFLKELIDQRHDDADFMEFLFTMIAEFAPERRKKLLGQFLQHNHDFENFRKLRLEPVTESWSGSRVPSLHRKQSYLQSLLPLLNSVELLQHKQYLERQIQGVVQRVEQEKKRDFVEQVGSRLPGSHKDDPVQRHKQAERLYEQALAAREKGNHEAARRFFEQAIGQSPKRDFFETYAKMERELREFDRARQVYRRAIEQFPDVGSLYEEYGMLERRIGKLTRAVHIFRQGLELAPDHKILHRHLAQVLVEMDDDSVLGEAEQQFELARRYQVLKPGEDEHYQKLLLLNEHPRVKLAWLFLKQAGFSVTPILAHRKGSAVDIVIRTHNPEYREAYNLTDEMLVRCFLHEETTYSDIQEATKQVSKVESESEHHPNRDVLFVVLKSAAHLRDAFYRLLEQPDQNMTVVPLEEVILQQALDANECEASLRHILDQWLYRRDLYQGNFPVSGRRFFGREEELTKLIRNIESGDHTGLFGLRKVGKTSVLHQLREKRSRDLNAYVDPQGAPPSARDCKYIYWSAANQWREQLEEKYPDVARELSFRLAGRYRSYADLPDTPHVAMEFDADIRLLRERLRSQETQPVKALLLLDEVELILPQAGRVPGWTGYAEFLTYLRGLAQETEFMVSIIAAANPRICEEPQLDGQDNPVFQFFQEMYLPPLERHECNEMIEKLGKGMGITYEPGALDRVYDETGGHPFIARRLCSRLAALFSERPLAVREKEVETAMAEYLIRDEAIFREIIERLERDFPKEKKLLEFVAMNEICQPEELTDHVSVGMGEALPHLLGYQLVAQDETGYHVRIQLLHRWLRRWLGEGS